jgi:type 1 fimbriae regulatory protein FimB
MSAANRRNVKCEPTEAVDEHVRGRWFFSPAEVEKLLKAAKRGRHGTRNHALLLSMYRHGLRVSEAVGLRRVDFDTDAARLWVSRLKGSLSTHQPVEGDEMRAIKRYLATRKDNLPWLFVSERGTQLTRQMVNHIVKQAGEHAGLERAHPHKLRHSCGFALADKGQDSRLIQDYLGHTDPRHTVRYTQTAARRFEGLWR